MRQSLPEHVSLPLDLVKRVDALCDRFEEAWVAGSNPAIEQYLRELPESDQPALLRELLRVELECRFRKGDTPTSEEYLVRFPEHAETVSQIRRQVAESTSVAAEKAAGGIPETVTCRGGEGTPTDVPIDQPKGEPAESERAGEPLGVAGYEIRSELGRGGMELSIALAKEPQNVRWR